MNRHKTKPRLLILGIDGGSPRIIDYLIGQGELQNLSSLISRGNYGILHSTLPPITPQAWSDFMTGSDAGRHGIYDFIETREGTYRRRFVNASFRHGNTIWRILSDKGYRVGAVNIPFTYPPEPLNGFIVCGVDAPGMTDDITYPPELRDDIVRHVGDFLLFTGKPAGKGRDAFFEHLKRVVENTSSISLYLMNRFQPDCFSVVFSPSDHIQHYFWDELPISLGGKGSPSNASTAIFDIYRDIDREIGRLISAFGRADLVTVLSDHGAAGLKKNVHLNRWLHSIGLLHYRIDARRGFPDTVRETMLTNFYRCVGRLRDFLKGTLPEHTKNRLKILMPRLEEKVESDLAVSEIDWKNTRAYAQGIYGNIYLNLRGREPEGVVYPGKEAELLLARIRSGLLRMTDPVTGESVVEEVIYGTEHYSQPSAGHPPDLIPLWHNWEYSCVETDLTKDDTIFWPVRQIEGSDLRLSALHHPDGILVMAGKNLKGRQKNFSAELRDIAPTLLYLSGEEIPSQMNGNVLSALIDPSFLDGNPPVRSTEECGGMQGGGAPPREQYSPEESEKIEKKLKGLGYID
jgi:predicted AlkP superfamily phosphohydrolase/phosphomutase